MIAERADILKNNILLLLFKIKLITSQTKKLKT